jgi:protein-L-isoaspartate(D-aspartate) O-methyltransferase
LVTAAPPSVPLPLLEQLALGGRLIIPVGGAGEVQMLERWTRHGPANERGAFEREHIADVRFVPFLGPGVSKAGAGES